MSKYRLSVAIPCFERPARTRRIINNLLAQNINGWEAFIIGDGCPYFDEMIESKEVEYFIKTAESNGNKIHCFNLEENEGGCGYHILNYAKLHAQGEYFLILNNDDWIEPNHFEHYLSEIENTDWDLLLYNAYADFVLPGAIREPSLQLGGVGHSEIIVKTELAKQVKHSSEYGHDWEFIKGLISSGAKHKVASSNECTYHVMATQGRTKEMID